MNEQICVIGTGYVGLVTGAGLASLGHRVTCLDVDEAKIEGLKQGLLPIYEPGLEAFIRPSVQQGRLAFSTPSAALLQQATMFFIAVGTPTTPDGDADLHYVHAVVEQIADVLRLKQPNIQTRAEQKIIVVKSTVPVGTCADIKRRIMACGVPEQSFEVVSNPEFLREGTAVHDFMHPDRIILGGSPTAVQRVQKLYQPLIDAGAQSLCTTLESSELIKYASNAMLALRITFTNEIARLCNNVGARVQDVTAGMGMDSRIGGAFLRPGPGFGGSCFPKDVRALSRLMQTRNVPGGCIISGIAASNQMHKKTLLDELLKLADGSVANKKITVLGLTFKANTDDIRDSFALEAIDWLKSQGAVVIAYDPQGMPNMRRIHGDIIYANSTQEAVSGAVLVVVITEWDEFKNLDLGQLATLCAQKRVLDLRNIFDPGELARHGFIFYNLGRV